MSEAEANLVVFRTSGFHLEINALRLCSAACIARMLHCMFLYPSKFLRSWKTDMLLLLVMFSRLVHVLLCQFCVLCNKPSVF